jgi:hypothetical protein
MSHGGTLTRVLDPGVALPVPIPGDELVVTMHIPAARRSLFIRPDEIRLMFLLISSLLFVSLLNLFNDDISVHTLFNVNMIANNELERMLQKTNVT